MERAELERVANAANSLRGKTIIQLRPPEIAPTSYDFHVRTIRHALTELVTDGTAEELFGTNGFKVVRLLPSGEAAESMSFPAFDPFELPDEEWPRSRFKGIVDNLVITMVRHPDDDPEGLDRDACVVEGAFVAVPHVDALGLMEQEWREGRELIRIGRWDALRKDSESRCIFIKRKGSGGQADVRQAPADQEAPKSSFWLTKDYLQELIDNAVLLKKTTHVLESRPRIYVVPASSTDARTNFSRTVEHPLDEASVEPAIDEGHLLLRTIARSSDGSLRAWGAKPGRSNTPRWEDVEVGDWVFFYWAGSYRYLTRVVGKPSRPQPALARALWNEDDESQTWELAYFVDAPRPIDVRADQVSEILGMNNQGWRAVPDARLAQLIETWGSVDAVIKAVTGEVVEERYFIFLQRPAEGSAYSDEEGERYRFDSNVTGRVPLLEAGSGKYVYYRPRRGADAATARTFFGAGTIVRVDTVGQTGDNAVDFVAELTDYVPFDRPVPSREYDPPGWNHQHSIASIPKDVYEEILRRGMEPGADVTDFGMDWLERETLLSREVLSDIIDALGSTQVVLAGSPGTGKTWVARAIVKHLTQGDTERMRIVQFHPSYGYEEFIEGLRPVWDEAKGGIAFQPVDGIVIRLADKAAAAGKTHYLLIDEMNRANLSRVFGELMFLFEYHNPEDAIELQYSGYSGYSEDGSARRFYLPENLRFIGTMNTADRSIRSIDTALRRRFEVFEFPPDARVLSGFYERPQNTNDVADLIAGFERLNEALTAEFDEHHTIGQTFFMKTSMTPTRLRNTWNRQVLPLIGEYFFDQPDRLEEFSVGRFWPSIG